MGVPRVKPHERFDGIYWFYSEDRTLKLATLNLTPGRKVYGERLVNFKGKEYRLWDPYRSKLAASIMKGIKQFPIAPSLSVLYLGAGTGTTVSHVSDILGRKGIVYCVEFAARAMRELVHNVSNFRDNIYPILEDARFPDRYRVRVRPVDIIYCDIAQPEQAKILADNADIYLKKQGYVMIAIKSRSIDVTQAPTAIFRKEEKLLQMRGFKILEKIRLEPFEKDHEMILAREL
jgi:fibrillarin-like pre-rRNA processing protein